MILVAVGTQDFQFNRLLQEIDRLIEKGSIREEVFAQTGYSTYQPRFYRHTGFTSMEEFDGLVNRCSLLVSHGGTGTIVGALKKGKKVIGVPRRKEYNEHVDNHQLELLQMFSQENLIYAVGQVEELESALNAIGTFEPAPFVKDNGKMIDIIEEFIEANGSK